MSNETPLCQWHQDNGGKMVDFAGWRLPVTYGEGLIAEHLATRKFGGLFDISHMGRFRVGGTGALAFLESALTNAGSKLEQGVAQYTLICNQGGTALDDAYLYKWKSDEYLLVVNAANKDKDWAWLAGKKPDDVDMVDISLELAMLAVQGPKTEGLIAELFEGELPPQGRNHGVWMKFQGVEVFVSRTGYTGEPVCFELFVPWSETLAIWQALVETGGKLGVVPVGLGARDTLRLEAALPLYGHEYTEDLPIMAVPTAKFGVSLGGDRADFIGSAAIAAQAAELKSGEAKVMGKHVVCVAAMDKGMMREGSQVFVGDREVGMLTSGTTVPAWQFEGDAPSGESYTRAIGLALVDRAVKKGDKVEVKYRKRTLAGRVVASFARPAGDYLKPNQF